MVSFSFIGRDSWDWVGPFSWGGAFSFIFLQSGVEAPRLLKRSLFSHFSIHCCFMLSFIFFHFSFILIIILCWADLSDLIFSGLNFVGTMCLFVSRSYVKNVNFLRQNDLLVVTGR